ncbi:MAG: type VII secretion protein EccE [Micrococcales bacterium]|nr:type VII secretion protein EccE [Micrococcales bacterium]
MPATSRDEYLLSPVKFSRLAKRGLLLGLSGAQLGCLGIAAIALVTALCIGGSIPLAVSALIWLPALVLALVPVQGRKLIEWAPIAWHWAARTYQGQTVFKKNLAKPRPAGTLALPGDAAALRQWDDSTTGACMIHDPHQQTLTAVVEVTHPSFVLLDPADQQRRVDSWGRVLATCTRSGRIARLQILERALPDSGSGLADWWRRHGHDDGTWTARVYQDLINRAGPASERHATTISLALDMRTASKAIRAAGGGMKGAASVLSQEMNTLTTALRSADLNPGRWLNPGQIAFILRSAYDPAASGDLERNPQIGRELATAGPVAVRETWDGLRTDSACHAVLWISEWPRAQVFPGFLSPILLSSGIRRAFSLTCTPLRADQAARDIRRKKTEHIADQAQRAKIGQIEDAAQTAEYHDVLQQEADLTSGHGICRYTGLIAISAPSQDELQAGIAAIEQAAVQASCETRLLVGQQAQAFAVAALPLCRAA